MVVSDGSLFSGPYPSRWSLFVKYVHIGWGSTQENESFLVWKQSPFTWQGPFWSKSFHYCRIQKPLSTPGFPGSVSACHCASPALLWCVGWHLAESTANFSLGQQSLSCLDSNRGVLVLSIVHHKRPSELPSPGSAFKLHPPQSLRRCGLAL